MEYSKDIQAALKKAGAEIGHKITIMKEGRQHTGILMPKAAGFEDTIVMKLDNGYNIGITYSKNMKIEKATEEKKLRKAAEVEVRLRKAVEKDKTKPTIAILHTGGTIASRVDYATGAVKAIVQEWELLEMFPELKNYGNIRSRMIFQMMSEDMQPDHWQFIAHEIIEEIREGCDGIIVVHGTDTMHYTSSALAFFIRELPIPVLLVGSQRSSDRPSSDAGMNLICAANFIANTDWSGVALCMHGSAGDDYCYILPACKTRKMHSSRRDAFRPINAEPIAKIYYETGAIEIFQRNYLRKDFSRIPKLDNKFDKRIGIVKVYPGFRAEQLEWFENNCKGIVIEGTGLGHTPITETDIYTRDNPKIEQKLKEMSNKGIFIYMTSQCIYGRVNLNVYSNLRKLKAAGVLPAYMLPEVAYVKLGWALGKAKSKEDVIKLMEQNIAGEIIDRSEVQEFPDNDMEKK